MVAAVGKMVSAGRKAVSRRDSSTVLNGFLQHLNVCLEKRLLRLSASQYRYTRKTKVKVLLSFSEEENSDKERDLTAGRDQLFSDLNHYKMSKENLKIKLLEQLDVVKSMKKT